MPNSASSTGCQVCVAFISATTDLLAYNLQLRQGARVSGTPTLPALSGDGSIGGQKLDRRAGVVGYMTKHCKAHMVQFVAVCDKQRGAWYAFLCELYMSLHTRNSRRAPAPHTCINLFELIQMPWN
jgi:hypothetical protein